MTSQLRQLLHTYTSRRSPWGPPLWIYGVAFGALNAVRHAVLIVSGAQIPQAARVASWVATALVVILAINTVAVALQRRGVATAPGQSPALAPMWPLRRGTERRHEPSRPHSTGAAGMKHQPPAHVARSTRWAPWWLYLVIIVGANYLRRAIVADGDIPAVSVVIALAQSAMLFVIITVVHRAHARSER
jgi:hypothetical protein